MVTNRRDCIVRIGWAGIGWWLVPRLLRAQEPPEKNPLGERPAHAITLFGGQGVSGWVHRGSGLPCRWRVADGYLEVVPRTGDLHTRQEFGDCRLHLEFWVPRMENATGQARGNSGVYLQGRYEIQVLDSYGIEKPTYQDCGAIYETQPPRVNACKPPEQWQTYDVLFRAPRFRGGQEVEPGWVTVYQNGILIHDRTRLKGATRASMGGDPARPGPLMLQDHGCPVRYRNIWIVPLENAG